MDDGDVFGFGIVLGGIIGIIVASAVIHDVCVSTAKSIDGERAFEDDNKYYIIREVEKKQYHEWWAKKEGEIK